METPEFLVRQFERYLRNECTPQEAEQLFRYFDAAENEEELRNLIREHLHSQRVSKAPHGLLEESFRRIKQTIAEEHGQRKGALIFARKDGFRWLAAAVLLLFISLSVIFIARKRDATPLSSQNTSKKIEEDFSAGRNSAILTLSDGRTIALDSASDGTLARQSGVQVVKLNGQIAYQDAGATGKTPVYNQISTARGNQYQLILADGSIVWLNASSSIRFPATFTGGERRVEISGEAYFEVTKDAARPFKVLIQSTKGSSEVEVLGTHFNINAYDDEPHVKTTLLEGAVKIKQSNTTRLLSPGQQATIAPGSIAISKDVDVESVIAWKNGFFVFNNTDLKTLMREVARWYDVDVEFKGGVDDEGFSGKISRRVALSKFLQILQLNDVQVKTEGRKVIIP